MWLCANENDGVTDSKMKTAVRYRIVISGVCRIETPCLASRFPRAPLCRDAHCPRAASAAVTACRRDFAVCRSPALAFLINPLRKLIAVEVRVEQPVAVEHLPQPRQLLLEHRLDAGRWPATRQTPRA